MQLDAKNDSDGGNTTDSSSSTSIKSDVHRIAFTILLPSSMNDTSGQVRLPILSTKGHLPVGHITVDYLFVRALNVQVPPQTMQTSYSRYWRKRGTLEVGHRGMGNSYTKYGYSLVYI